MAHSLMYLYIVPVACVYLCILNSILLADVPMLDLLMQPDDSVMEPDDVIMPTETCDMNTVIHGIKPDGMCQY